MGSLRRAELCLVWDGNGLVAIHGLIEMSGTILIECSQKRLSSWISNGCSQGEHCIGYSMKSQSCDASSRCSPNELRMGKCSRRD